MNKPYVIAEMGVNFYDTAKVLGISPLAAAKLYIDKAAEVGIDCAKFQSYKAGTIVSKNSPAYWDTTKEPTKTQYELFLKHDSFIENSVTTRTLRVWILHQHLLIMHQRIILKIWSISIRFLLQTFQIFHLFVILVRKENQYICLLVLLICPKSMWQ